VEPALEEAVAVLEGSDEGAVCAKAAGICEKVATIKRS
jgi:hypothetical protein